MSLSHEKQGNVVVATITGQVNSANAARLQSDLMALIDDNGANGHKVVLDLGGVDYMSSAGLRVVLMLAKRIQQAQGDLIVCGLQPNVYEVFDVSGFLALLQVADNRDQAIQQIS